MNPFWVSTPDDIKLSAIKNNPATVEKRILCFHMRPATKESYIPFLKLFEEHNWLALAIDFRGHGQSTNNGRLNHEEFTNEERKKYRIDAVTALDNLGETDCVIGASIGANVALNLQADKSITQSILLSPGVNYFDIETLPAAEKLGEENSVYIIASQERGGEMAQEAQKIYDAIPGKSKTIDVFPGQEHGTNIVVNYPERMEKIVNFIRQL